MDWLIKSVSFNTIFSTIVCLGLVIRPAIWEVCELCNDFQENFCIGLENDQAQSVFSFGLLSQKIKR